jgi:hypothetical protein
MLTGSRDRLNMDLSVRNLLTESGGEDMRRSAGKMHGLVLTCLVLCCLTDAGATTVDEFLDGIESVVFIADLSGPTQQGGEQSLNRLRLGVAASISMLDPECTFDILSNAGDHSCFGTLRSASQTNLADAAGWIRDLTGTGQQEPFPAFAAESGVPPYDECMTFVLFVGGTQNMSAWNSIMPVTDRFSWIPEGASLNFVLVPPVSDEFQALCGIIADVHGGKVLAPE